MPRSSIERLAASRLARHLDTTQHTHTHTLLSRSVSQENIKRGLETDRYSQLILPLQRRRSSSLLNVTTGPRTAAAGPSLLLAQRPRTPSHTIYATHHFPPPAQNIFLKFCFQIKLCVFSALEIFCRCAIINLRFTYYENIQIK